MTTLRPRLSWVSTIRHITSYERWLRSFWIVVLDASCDSIVKVESRTSSLSMSGHPSDAAMNRASVVLPEPGWPFIATMTRCGRASSRSMVGFELYELDRCIVL
ncbi:hypothetical protein HanIR_Chr05g0243851 [Helianthus annuus]|nr:hypothetical protein HanIR_Chr05g0243851 [Helianthus annuus]